MAQQTIDDIFAEWDASDKQQALTGQAVQKMCQLLTIMNAAYMQKLRDQLADGTCPGEVQALLLRLALWPGSM